MTRRPLALGAVALSVAAMLAMATGATAGNGREKATGGGQVVLSSDPDGLLTGAYNTIAFTAQEKADGSTTGQVQYISREAGTGQSQVKFHGIVDCLIVEATLAHVEGHARGDSAARFTLLAQDNGEGANATDSDMVFFDESDPTAGCEVDDDEEDNLALLARGNVQVRDDA